MIELGTIVSLGLAALLVIANRTLDKALAMSSKAAASKMASSVIKVTGCAFSDLQGHVTMGNYCRLHSSVHLAKGSVLGDHVFIYPYAVLTNDRFPPSMTTNAPAIGHYTQIGVHAVILAGVSIGAHCLIAANATVANDVDDHSFMIGSPAVLKKDVRDLKGEDGSPLYPWPARFDRGMPWKNDM